MATKAGTKVVDLEIVQRKEKGNKRAQKVKSKEKENQGSIGKREKEFGEDVGQAKKRARRVASPFSAAQ